MKTELRGWVIHGSECSKGIANCAYAVLASVVMRSLVDSIVNCSYVVVRIANCEDVRSGKVSRSGCYISLFPDELTY